METQTTGASYFDDFARLPSSPAFSSANRAQRGRNQFLKMVNRKMLLSAEIIEDLLRQMKNYQAPVVAKWITKKKN